MGAGSRGIAGFSKLSSGVCDCLMGAEGLCLAETSTLVSWLSISAWPVLRLSRGFGPGWAGGEAEVVGVHLGAATGGQGPVQLQAQASGRETLLVLRADIAKHAAPDQKQNPHAGGQARNLLLQDHHRQSEGGSERNVSLAIPRIQPSPGASPNAGDGKGHRVTPREIRTMLRHRNAAETC